MNGIYTIIMEKRIHWINNNLKERFPANKCFGAEYPDIYLRFGGRSWVHALIYWHISEILHWISQKTLLIVESSNTHKDCSLTILHYCNLASWRMFPLTLFSPTNVLARARYHWTRESAAAVHKMTDWRHRDWRRASRGSREAEQQQHPILQTAPHQSHTTSEVFSHWASSKNNGRDISQTIG